MSLQYRLLEFCSRCKISTFYLAERLEISLQTAENLLSLPENIPNDLIINIIRNFSELNAHWLLTGEGEMLNNSKKESMKQHVVHKNNGTIINFQGDSLGSELLFIQQEINHMWQKLKKLEDILIHK